MDASESQGPKNRTGSHSPMYLLNKCFLRIYHVPGLGGTDVSKTKNSCPPGADILRRIKKISKRVTAAMKLKDALLLGRKVMTT